MSSLLNQTWVIALLGAALIGAVLAAVHHAELIAHKIGEPFGTLVLALSITIIEVALIVSMMLAGNEGSEFIARDAIFATIMIIMNGVGIPPEGIALILGVDRFLDMCRTTLNVSGDLVIAALVDDKKPVEA